MNTHYKLLVDSRDHSAIKSENSFMGAIRTIVIADALMGLDNVLAIAGASHGEYFLVILGLLISIPMIMWGSTLFLKWVERYSWIVFAGFTILAFTSGKMIMSEPIVEAYFRDVPLIKWLIIGLIIFGVVLLGLRTSQKQSLREGSQSVKNL